MKGRQSIQSIESLSVHERIDLTNEDSIHHHLIFGSIITSYGVVRVTAENKKGLRFTLFEIVKNGEVIRCWIDQFLDYEDVIDTADRFARWIGEGTL